jgi:DNA-binding Lrp family transcriptional regulator
MKEVEFKLIAELMKNSCRSDRELAKAMGVSQPTVSRVKARLQKEGYILEYTIVPNFNKIGYHLFALTFFCWKKGIGKEEMEEARKWAQDKAPSVPSNIILIERGIGLGYDSFMGSFHKDYTSYVRLLDEIKKNPYVDISGMESFIVNLDDKIHYRYLTFSMLAKHLLETNKEESKEQ